jgi:predicted nuclease of predicted toxin-antitoxin system
MRFLADENVSGVAIDRLLSLGHDVVPVAGTEMGASDREVIARANHEGRVLITEDRDFGELVIRHRLPVQAVLLLEMDSLSNDAEAQRLAEVVTALGGTICGKLVVIEPSRTRTRPLRALD